MPKGLEEFVVEGLVLAFEVEHGYGPRDGSRTDCCVGGLLHLTMLSAGVSAVECRAVSR
jgi:hypothetical protein